MSKIKNIIVSVVIWGMCVLIIFPIVMLMIPCKVYKLPFLYSMISLVEETDIPQEINEDDEDIIKCRYADIDFFEKKIFIEFYIYDSNEAEIFSLIVNEVSDYLKNSHYPFRDYKVELCVQSMGVDSLQAFNYDVNGSINVNPYEFKRCNYKAIDGCISSLKNYDWVEVLGLRQGLYLDDISVIHNMPNLKEIVCSNDIFTVEQKRELVSVNSDLKFTVVGNDIDKYW